MLYRYTVEIIHITVGLRRYHKPLLKSTVGELLNDDYGAIG